MKRKKRNFAGSVTDVRPPLSDTQADYLRTFTQENVRNLKYLALRRGVSYEAVRKMRRKLIELGYMDRRYNAVVSPGLSPQPDAGARNWVANGYEYVVTIIAGQYADSYLRARGKNEGLQVLRGSTLLLHEGKVEVRVGVVFEADHPRKAHFRVVEYVVALLRTLEARVPGLILLKDGYQNVHRVRGELAHPKDAIALKPENEKLRVFNDETGKQRIVVDWSPGRVPEIEFVDAKHSLPDASKYEAFLDDLVKRPQLPLSELGAAVAEAQRLQLAFSRDLQAFAQVSTQNAQLQASVLKLQHELLQAQVAPRAEPSVEHWRRWGWFG